MNKRLLKEVNKLIIQQQQKILIENDYIVYMDETNINKVYGMIKGPNDSVYRHKFIKLEFDIPQDYPHSPPKVKFINHDAVRIHPILYEDGRTCATILNTWGDSKFEKWTSSMGIETILINFHSFLDNNPYQYEPGGRDEPSYTVYVKHQTWKTCLLRYLEYETIGLFKQYMNIYILNNMDNIINDLILLNENYPKDMYNCRCYEIYNYIINYEELINTLQERLYNFWERNIDIDIEIDQEFEENNEMNLDDIIEYGDFKCCICYDTTNGKQIVETKCHHKFHKKCFTEHLDKNGNVCPMCRMEINDEEETVINPLTKRRIKINSATYKKLVKNNII